jgi:multidrug resistance protein MdtO
MGIFFDLLWVRNPLDEMQAVFAHNLELFAELSEQLLEQDQIKAIKRIRQLRDQLHEGFQAVTAQSDAVLLEFGPARRRKLEIREDIRRWQPSIRTLLQLQMTVAQYRAERPLQELPPSLAEAYIAFERDIALIMRALANEVNGKPSDPTPDPQIAARRLEQEVRKHYSTVGGQLSSRGADIVSLAESMASTLAPLYQDIYATFADSRRAIDGQPRYIRRELRS